MYTNMTFVKWAHNMIKHKMFLLYGATISIKSYYMCGQPVICFFTQSTYSYSMMMNMKMPIYFIIEDWYLGGGLMHEVHIVTRYEYGINISLNN